MFCIITTAQHILVHCMDLEGLPVCVSTVMRYKNKYVWQEECKFLYFRYVEFLMEVHNLWLHHDKLFSCIKSGSYNGICKNLTQLTLFLFIQMVSTIHITTCNVLIHMKTYCWANIWIVLIWFWTWKINLCKLCTTMKHIFPMRERKIWWWIRTHCFHRHVRWYLKHMLTMWHDRVLYVSNKWLAISSDLLFCALQLLFLIFPTKQPRHDNKDECMIFADMQHSHPHMNLYLKIIF